MRALINKKCENLVRTKELRKILNLIFHRQRKASLAAIQHFSNSFSDWFNISSLSKYSVFNGLSSEFLKKSSSRDGSSLFPLRTCKRSIYPKSPPDKPKPLPRLLYVQNPIQWATNKLDFRFLRVNWDPLFSEAEFTRGARQALSKVTQLLSSDKFDSMKPLFTKTALLNLRRDVELTWSDEVKRHIVLAPEDIQLIIPRKLYFRQSSEPKLLERGFNLPATNILATSKPKREKKYCDIDVLFIALKYLNSQRFQGNPLCFLDIIARFQRNYSEDKPSDWLINGFKVRKFQVVPQHKHN